MTECTEPNLGILLHAYELGALPEDKEQQFEAHVLKCEYCFKEMKRSANLAVRLRHDTRTQAVVHEVVNERTRSFAGAGWRSLFPFGTPALRPILALALVLLVAVPVVYLIVRSMRPAPISEVSQIVDLTPTRSAGNASCSKSAGEIALLRFEVDSDAPNQAYRIEIRNEDGAVVYEHDEFRSIDNGLGLLQLRMTQLAVGIYRLSITDRVAESAFAPQEYHFTITE